MATIPPTTASSSWLQSVAEVLPLPHRAVAPYTLGEAIDELGSYAQATTTLDWQSSRAVKKNLASLRAEITAQAQTIGARLRRTIAAPLAAAHDGDREATVVAAARFREAWRSKAAVSDAFRDLCEAAALAGARTHELLRLLSAIIASQIGPAAGRPFSLLREAADALVDTEEELARKRNAPLLEPLTEARRLEVAEGILVAIPAGRVVVWTVYDRATVWGMRTAAGPLTFLRPEWALPNAFDQELHDFPERAELRQIREGVGWLDDLHVESLKAENRLALVRVDLGERQLAGAVEEARLRIEAVLSIAVQAGGVSWQSPGAAAVLLDGEVRVSSFGLTIRDHSNHGDSYGMGATAEILTKVADELGDALSKRPMPERLVEALTSLREARMTDHRDVTMYGARRVTPRVATALEDHAMELIASVLGVRSDGLASALQRREALDQVDRLVLSRLMAPFRDSRMFERAQERRELEDAVSHYVQGGILVVSVAKAVALREEIRALPMSRLQRADFEEGLAICTDPAREGELLDDMWRMSCVIRARHRRVRNAVNHGLPLSATTLNSVRDYADATSRTALDLALDWFKNGELGATLLEREQRAWAERFARIEAGNSWASEDARSEQGQERASEDSSARPQ